VALLWPEFRTCQQEALEAVRNGPRGSSMPGLPSGACAAHSQAVGAQVAEEERAGALLEGCSLPSAKGRASESTSKNSAASSGSGLPNGKRRTPSNEQDYMKDPTMQRRCYDILGVQRTVSGVLAVLQSECGSRGGDGHID